MELRMLDVLICPFDKQKLSLIEFDSKSRQKELIEEGLIYCSGCQRWFPVVEGIPRIFPDNLRRPAELEFLHKHKNEIPPGIRLGGKPFNLDENLGVHPSFKEASRKEEFAYKSQAILERDRQAHLYDARYRGYQNEVEIPTTLKRLDLKKDDFLLDVGVGTGRFTENYIGNCREVVGIDSSFESLMVLKRKMEEKNFSNLHLLQCDLCFLPFKEEVFDKVLSAEVFQSIFSLQSRKQGLAGIKRVLKNKGVFVISAYNYSNLKKLYKMMGRKDIYDKTGYHSDGEIFYYNFSSRELRQLLSRYFKVMKLCGILNGIPQISKRLNNRLRTQLDFFMEKTPFSFMLGHLLLAKCRKEF